jgi:hypothetical protein
LYHIFYCRHYVMLCIKWPVCFTSDHWTGTVQKRISTQKACPIYFTCLGNKMARLCLCCPGSVFLTMPCIGVPCKSSPPPPPLGFWPMMKIIRVPPPKKNPISKIKPPTPWKNSCGCLWLIVNTIWKLTNKVCEDDGYQVAPEKSKLTGKYFLSLVPANPH